MLLIVRDNFLVELPCYKVFSLVMVLCKIMKITFDILQNTELYL